jgi:signal peptidase I
MEWMKYLPTWLKKTIAIVSQLIFVMLILSGGLVIFHNLYFIPVKIVGRSMEPTLFDQEFGVMDQNVNTLNALDRFDIVIVQQNPNVDRYLIKRLIGLPGETISIDEDGLLTVDQIEVAQTFITENGYIEYTCINDQAMGCQPITLLEDQYFVMGDNRGFSTDSRVFGPITTTQLIGKLIAIEGMCGENTNEEDPNACSQRDFFWPRIYA